MKSFTTITKILSMIIVFMLTSLSTYAQFYSNGDDPGHLKWNYITTSSYRIIYPQGCDSLAKNYGINMEKFHIAESISSGLIPGEGYKRKTPVILHAFHGISNGMVTWAPKRADLYTLPEAYNPNPIPWVTDLAVHESRHLAQMQFGYKGWLRPLTWILGDMAIGAYSAIWPNNWFLEGDAVTAETALTKAGRGRSADFLDYYMAAFENGDTRNWYRWRYGSYRYYTPDHYALGYMTIAGARYCFNDPLFTERYFSRIATNPFRFFNTQKTMKSASGKSFKDSFSLIMNEFSNIWKEERKSHEPFTETTSVQNPSKWFQKMYGNISLDGKIYSICSGIAESSYLTEYDPSTGILSRLRPFASGTSRLRAGGEYLWWSESIPDERWSLKMDSKIFRYNPKNGKTQALTHSGRFFNPNPSPDGNTITAVEYPSTGGTFIIIVNAEDGSAIQRLKMPDSLQVVEACNIGDVIAFSAISDSGYGIFLTNNNLTDSLRCILPPLHVSIHNLYANDSTLYFSSDRDGTQELYSIELPTGKTRIHTSLPYGGDEFCINGNDLYFSKLTHDGRLLHKITNIRSRDVIFSDIHKYKVAETLTLQEKEIAKKKGIVWPDTTFKADIQDATRYRKPLHILRFHTWAPVYFNYDNIRNLSGDFDYETASVGATALFQNDLSTAYGSLGYSFHKDPYSYAYGKQKYRHSGHVSFTYSGLYPVFEFSADFNDMAAVKYMRQNLINGSNKKESITGLITNKPSLRGNVSIYLPLNFSSGGWNRGVIPQIEYELSNDIFDKSMLDLTYDGNFSGQNGPSHITNYTTGSKVFMHRIKASLRGYILRPVPSSGIYPRFGAGFEVGYHARTSMTDIYTPSEYIYLYGYLPGITLTQGLKISAKSQYQQGSATRRENAITVTPRGFGDSGADYFIRQHANSHLLLSADYVIPIWAGDISCFSPFFYIKDFEVTPHFDYGIYGNSGKFGQYSLFSTGAMVTAHLANLLWIPYDCRIGFIFDINGGKSFKQIKNGSYNLYSHHLGFVFSISL